MSLKPEKITILHHAKAAWVVSVPELPQLGRHKFIKEEKTRRELPLRATGAPCTVPEVTSPTRALTTIQNKTS